MHLSHNRPRIQRALLHTDGNLTRAARRLGVSKPYFIELVGRLRLNRWARRLRRLGGLPATGRPPLPVRRRRRSGRSCAARKKG